MSHAEICPVCKGKGTKRSVNGIAGDEAPIPCHGCGGRGWVEVGTEYPVQPVVRPIMPSYGEPELCPTWLPIEPLLTPCAGCVFDSTGYVLFE